MFWGANAEDWQHFDIFLGQKENLLPVVSNPNSEISPRSKIKKLGKTPSVFSPDGVVGISKWTSKKASDYDIGLWSAERNYGICLQTREVRALDFDITDQNALENILKELTAMFPFIATFPKRLRFNSSNMLLAFIIKGEHPKRVVKTEHGIIEFLANGQQFIAVGTHPSGAKYQWENGLPSVFPEISIESFNEIWNFLKKYAIVSTELTIRRRGETIDIKDPVVESLDILGTGNDGQLFIRCPFEDEHTTDTGIASTCYFPAGTNGYECGHFKCLHAHCADRTDADFLDALGIRASAFEVIKVTDRLPAFKRNAKGAILANRSNLDLALSNPELCGVNIHFDEFLDDVMFSPNGESSWRTWKDTDYTRIMLHLERNGFENIDTEKFRQGVYKVAEDNPKDSAKSWLTSLRWDGIRRIEYFMPVYFKTEDTEYAKSLSLYIWTALAGRVMSPGIKTDMVPVFEGVQGLRKSTAVEAICPSREFFRVISFSEREEEKSRKLRACLVAEIAELHGLHTKEAEEIKAWVTKTHEEWTPKYKEKMHTFPRRCVFFGTTNETEILSDPTGNRRWLPIHVEDAKVEDIIRDRDQLWAEALMEFEYLGVDYTAETKVEHTKFIKYDSWEDSFSRWLSERDSNVPFTTAEALQGALYMAPATIKSADTKRAHGIISRMGYKTDVIREENHFKRVWIKK